MSALALVMPIMAAGSLTIALLVPLRDARRGERATLRGRTPIRSSFEAEKHVETRETNVSPVNRLYRTIDAISETFVLVLGLRPRRAPSQVTDDAFESQLANLLDEPAPAETCSPSIEDEGECVSRHDGSVTRETIEFEAREADELQSFHTSQPMQGWKDGTLLARDLPPPLTRLRLRPDAGAIAWPMHLPMPHLGATEAERRIILTDLEKTAEAVHERALTSAYREEDASGRMLALRALSRISTEGARAILADALTFGSDDERALAVDLLSTSEHRESLVSALHDRVDAIAARAALAYVRSNRRSEYEKLRSSGLDERRLETILALLGGILE
jgi:hypothetical protein